MRPDGKRGPGLFAYLRGLTSANGDDRRDVIATVFSGVENRMRSGYLLRDVINKIAGIHFTAIEELHTLGALYESMLREMRDAAGDSGEFYTPRAVVRFMVEVTDPRLGETVLDPAAGTGGFLVEAFTISPSRCKTVADRQLLQDTLALGLRAEAAALSALPDEPAAARAGCPADRPRQRLRFKLTEIGEKDRVDVILTNPPFGGEEEKGIQGNFPEDKQTAETALLFLQLIMRKLQRGADLGGAAGARRGGRAQRHALRRRRLRPHQGGAAQGVQPAHHRAPAQRRVRALHRHPDQPALLRPLRADEGSLVLRAAAARGPEELHQDAPIQFEEFAECIAWWGQREEGPQAWKVSGPELIRSDEAGRVVAVNLDMKNPAAKEAVDHRAPAEIVAA